jgi:FHA domain
VQGDLSRINKITIIKDTIGVWCMDNFGVVFAAIVGGMICGAAVVAGLFFLYVRMSKREKLTVALTRSEEATFLKPPARRAIPPQTGIPWLEGIGGQVVGQRINIAREEMMMGRSRVCDIRFDDPKISRQHAMLRLYKGHYFIQDMQSSRGVLVNSQRIQTHHLQDGDQIRIGDTVLIFHLTPRESG